MCTSRGTILITGVAGFIGFHLSKLLVNNGYKVVGIDNINDYYDVNLKYLRLKELGIYGDYIVNNQPVEGKIIFYKTDLKDAKAILSLFKTYQFNFVVNLAAQAGVRYSIENPQTYIDNNITGFLNVLEAIRLYPVKHLIFASSSSVYGLNKSIPFSVRDGVDHPIAMYAVSKKSNELMAHSYAHLFKIPCTGLRFFTVYGPWGRPDMALHLFTKSILEGKPLEVYNHGEMNRDFTYIDDIVESIRRLIVKPPIEDNTLFDAKCPDPSISSAPYRLFNIGNNNPVGLIDFIKAIEDAVGKKGKKVFKPIQAGDVPSTYANVNSLFDYIDFRPKTPIEKGVRAFVERYLKIYDEYGEIVC